MFFGKWREVYCGIGTEALAGVRNALDDAGIAHRYKMRTHDALPPFRGRARELMGRVGERSEYAAVCYVFVRREDEDRARAVVRQALGRSGGPSR